MAEDDVTTTLSELERKLKDLEQELQGAPAAPSPASPAAAPVRLLPGELHAQLVRFRERLERSARELMEEYERLLADVQASADTWSAVPTTPDGVLKGTITVDAGPFADIATLAGFERALGTIQGVGGVHVHGFDGARALIRMTLEHPIALEEEMRRVVPMPLAVTRLDLDRVSVTVELRQ